MDLQLATTSDKLLLHDDANKHVDFKAHHSSNNLTKVGSKALLASAAADLWSKQ